MTTKRIVMTTDSRIRTRLVTSLWALLSILVITVAPGPASAATFTVTSAADDSGCNLKPIYPSLGFASSCTLRGAIEAVNAQPQGSGPHRINFSIGSGDQTIVLTKALQEIKRPVVIDGGTQPVVLWSKTGLTIGMTTTTCAAVNINNRHPCIQVNAHRLYTPVLTLAAGNSTVRYLAIYNYSSPPVAVDDSGTGVLVTSDNNLLEFNYIGIDPSGVLVPKQMNQQQGVAVHPPQGQIPPVSAANTVIRNNVISGNRQNGVLLSGSFVNNSHLVSNFIGTTADGLRAALPPDHDPFTCDNSHPQWGVSIQGGANNNWIQGNLISGNCNGVLIDATKFTEQLSPETALKTWNHVLGNRIGTDSTGLSCLPNVVFSDLLYGVRILNASSNFVGETAGTVNVISCHPYGVNIQTSNAVYARDNKVLGNDIGTNAGAKLGNTTGVLLSQYVTGTEISGNDVENNGKDGINVSSANLGTDDPNAPQFNFVQNNTVSNNGVNGIVMQSGTIGNTVESNTALGNQPDLREDNSNTSSCPNTWITNTFVTSGGTGYTCIH